MHEVPPIRVDKNNHSVKIASLHKRNSQYISVTPVIVNLRPNDLVKFSTVHKDENLSTRLAIHRQKVQGRSSRQREDQPQ